MHSPVEQWLFRLFIGMGSMEFYFLLIIAIYASEITIARPEPELMRAISNLKAIIVLHVYSSESSFNRLSSSNLTLRKCVRGIALPVH